MADAFSDVFTFALLIEQGIYKSSFKRVDFAREQQGAISVIFVCSCAVIKTSL
jgi:hypothetical protein